MTDDLLSLLADYGTWALAATTFLSCLALPVPASFAMLAAGGFMAAGDLSAPSVIASAFVGAVAGDQVGFFAGRLGAARLEQLASHPKRGRMLRTATRDLRHKGTPLVFFSRWLVSPLGPYVNFVAGATGLTWRKFVAADLAGEAVWVLSYVGLGYVFAENVALLADILGSLSGLLAALAVAGAAGVWLIRSVRRHGEQRGT